MRDDRSANEQSEHTTRTSGITGNGNEDSNETQEKKEKKRERKRDPNGHRQPGDLQALEKGDGKETRLQENGQGADKRGHISRRKRARGKRKEEKKRGLRCG